MAVKKLGRSHNVLTGQLGSSDGYHLSATDYTDLTDSGDSSLHYHSSDRSLTNATGTLGESNGGTGETAYTSGQLLIGNSAGGLTKSTITAGSGVSVSNGDGSITISATGGSSGYTALTSTTDFSTTAASTSTITMNTDQRTNIKPGYAIRFTLSGTTYYAICTAITSSLLTIAGAPLTTGAGALTALAYANESKLMVMKIDVPGYYEDASDSALVLHDLNTSILWRYPAAYAVAFRVWSKIHDTASAGSVQVYINGATLCTTSAGLRISASATWYSTVVDINTTNYDIQRNEAIEIGATLGYNGGARDLTVDIIFVFP